MYHAVDEREGGSAAFGLPAARTSAAAARSSTPGGSCSRGNGPSVMSRYSAGIALGEHRGTRPPMRPWLGRAVGGGVEGLAPASSKPSAMSATSRAALLGRRLYSDGARIPSLSPSRRMVRASGPSVSSRSRAAGDDLPGARAQRVRHAMRQRGSSARCLSALFIAAKAGRVWRSSERAISGTRTP